MQSTLSGQPLLQITRIRNCAARFNRPFDPAFNCIINSVKGFRRGLAICQTPIQLWRIGDKPAAKVSCERLNVNPILSRACHYCLSKLSIISSSNLMYIGLMGLRAGTVNIPLILGCCSL